MGRRQNPQAISCFAFLPFFLISVSGNLPCKIMKRRKGCIVCKILIQGKRRHIFIHFPPQLHSVTVFCGLNGLIVAAVAKKTEMIIFG